MAPNKITRDELELLDLLENGGAEDVQPRALARMLHRLILIDRRLDWHEKLLYALIAIGGPALIAIAIAQGR